MAWIDVRQTLRIATVDATGRESCQMKLARGGPRPSVWETQAPHSRPIFQIEDVWSLRYRGGGYASSGGVRRDPIPGLFNALISTGFVIANGHCKSTVPAADDGVADKSL